MTQETDPTARWQVTCDCGWRVHGGRAEVVAAVQAHGRDVHGLNDTTEEQVMALAVPADRP